MIESRGKQNREKERNNEGMSDFIHICLPPHLKWKSEPEKEFNQILLTTHTLEKYLLVERSTRDKDRLRFNVKNCNWFSQVLSCHPNYRIGV